MANNYSECQTPLASNSDCIGCAALSQTSDTRDVLSPFAMMTSLQQTSDVLTEQGYHRFYAILRDHSKPASQGHFKTRQR